MLKLDCSIHQINDISHNCFAIAFSEETRSSLLTAHLVELGFVPAIGVGATLGLVDGLVLGTNVADG